MPAAKAAASVAVHAAVAAVTWQAVRATAEVAYTQQEVKTGRVERAKVVAVSRVSVTPARTGASFTQAVHGIRWELIGDDVVRIDDDVFVIDSLRFDYAQVLAELVVVDDVLVAGLVFGRNFADSVTATDTFIAGFLFDRTFADTVTAVEALSFLMGRSFADSVTVLEVMRVDLSKVLADSASAADSMTTAMSYSSSFADSVTALDAVVLALTYARNFADAVVATDAPFFSVGKVLADTATASDAFTQSVGKALADSATPADAVVKDIALIAATQPCRLIVNGVDGSRASTPDSPAHDVFNDFEAEVKVAATTWSAGVRQFIFGKFTEGGNQRAWLIDLEPVAAGSMQTNFFASNDGAALVAASFGGVSPFVNGQVGFLKYTRVKATGLTSCFVSPNGYDWVPFGTPQVLLAGLSMFAGIEPLVVGAFRAGGNEPFIGSIYRCRLRDGIGGPVVADFDPGRWVSGNSFVAVTGETWTVAGGASIACSPFYDAVTASDTPAFVLTLGANQMLNGAMLNEVLL